MFEKVTMRAGDSNYFSGAHLRGKKRPIYVLVNMGQNRVAFGRNDDVINPAASAQIRSRKDLQTFPIQEVLRKEVISERGLMTGPWQTAMVLEEDITEPFRAKGETEEPAFEPIFNSLNPDFLDFGIQQEYQANDLAGFLRALEILNTPPADKR